MTSEAATTGKTLAKWLKGASAIGASILFLWGAGAGIKTGWDSYLDKQIREETRATKQLLGWFLQTNPTAAKSFKEWKKEQDCIELMLDGKICQ